MDNRQAMNDAWNRCVPAPDAPTFTLDRQIDCARREMGPERWQELNGEWPNV
jgi:hypothetical protein